VLSVSHPLRLVLKSRCLMTAMASGTASFVWSVLSLMGLLIELASRPKTSLTAGTAKGFTPRPNGRKRSAHHSLEKACAPPPDFMGFLLYIIQQSTSVLRSWCLESERLFFIMALSPPPSRDENKKRESAAGFYGNKKKLQEEGGGTPNCSTSGVYGMVWYGMVWYGVVW